MIPVYFLRLSKVWILNPGFAFFFFFFFFFRYKICVFITFISFVDIVSNFRIRILTNQKHELLVSNWQWNCMPENLKVFQNFVTLKHNIIKHFILTIVYVSSNYSVTNRIPKGSMLQSWTKPF